MKIKIEKPLKKVKALKQQKERDEQLLKPAVRIQELKNKLIPKHTHSLIICVIITFFLVDLIPVRLSPRRVIKKK